MPDIFLKINYDPLRMKQVLNGQWCSILCSSHQSIVINDVINEDILIFHAFFLCVNHAWTITFNIVMLFWFPRCYRRNPSRIHRLRLLCNHNPDLLLYNMCVCVCVLFFLDVFLWQERIPFPSSCQQVIVITVNHGL